MAGAVVGSESVRALSCPNCGGAVMMRGMAHTRTVVCERCASVLDASDPGLRVLQRFDERMRVEPRIPLGSRGTLHGDVDEVIGFQQRTITVEGIPYSWREYVLFNPYKGFRYLTEYDGHWNEVVTVRALPVLGRDVHGRPTATIGTTLFRHFQCATARTTFVLGEFPWEVRVDDEVEVNDFVAPPQLLSSERTADETTWSLGTYISGDQLWRSFALPGRAPAPRGVYANQPAPQAAIARRMGRVFFFLLAAYAAILVATIVLTGRERVFAGEYRFAPGMSAEQAAFVTEPFELRGRTSDVELSIDAGVLNSWLYFNLALINDQTGTAYDFGREVSYYSGVEDGERWTEGSQHDRSLIPSVPSGRYYLRVAPEGPAGAPAAVVYRLTIRRDVPVVSFFWIALILLIVPPVWAAMRAVAVEQARWRESDYASGGSGEE